MHTSFVDYDHLRIQNKTKQLCFPFWVWFCLSLYWSVSIQQPLSYLSFVLFSSQMSSFRVQCENGWFLFLQLKDKDQSLLDERIKRSMKNKPATKQPVIEERPHTAPVSQATARSQWVVALFPCPWVRQLSTFQASTVCCLQQLGLTCVSTL